MRPMPWIGAFVAALSLFSTTARAQVYPPPSYNAQRAYRHFLDSPYSFRTYSGSYPGFSAGRFTPYGYEQYSQGPGYIHEEITPRGFERRGISPSRQGLFIPYQAPAYVPVSPYGRVFLP